MHILLINSNPVISRLLALCTRDDAFFLEEVSAMENVKRDRYNVVFVDEASYGDGVKGFLEKMTETLKVFISFDAVQMPGFDESIKKPFLPSEIRELIKKAQDLEEEIAAEKPFIFPLAQEEEDKSEPEMSSEEVPEESIEKVEEDIEKSLVEEATHLLEISEAEEDEGQEEVDNNAEEERFIEKVLEEASMEKELVEEQLKPQEAEDEKDEQDESLEDQPLTVLNADEIEKIKALLEMDDTLEVEDEVLSEEELEARKIEVIKEQLIADGLEIVEENEMLEELSIQRDGSLEKDENPKKKSKKKKSKKIKFTEENMEHIEDAVEMAMATMTKKQMKKLLKGKEVSITIKLEGKN